MEGIGSSTDDRTASLDATEIVTGLAILGGFGLLLVLAAVTGTFSVVIFAALLVALLAYVVRFLPFVPYDGPRPMLFALFFVAVGLVIVFL